MLLWLLMGQMYTLIHYCVLFLYPFLFSHRGPTVAVIDDINAIKPHISNLVMEGVYYFELFVENVRRDRNDTDITEVWVTAGMC